jgi:leucyl/phenylalanyl-tRNA--protein transferase
MAPVLTMRKTARVRAKDAAKSVARFGVRIVTRLVGVSRLTSWAIETSPNRHRSVIDVNEATTPFIDLTPAEIAGSYLRGYFLIGRDDPQPVPWLWHVGSHAVIDAASARVPSRVKTYVRRTELVIDATQPLLPVIRACAEREWTWIVPPVIDAWLRAEAAGLTATWTVRRGDELIAGMWGISIGRTFGIASMFHREDGAGAIAMATLLGQIGERWDLIDCGHLKPHFSRFGAYEITSEEFCARALDGIIHSGAVPEPRDDGADMSLSVG